MAQFGDLERRLHVGDKAVLPDVVERHREAVVPDVLRARIEPEEVVGQEDRLRVTDVQVAHHHLEVHAGAVLAHLAGGAEHFDVEQRMLPLQPHEGRRNEPGAEAVGCADPYQAREDVFGLRDPVRKRTESSLDRLGGCHRLIAKVGQFPAVRAAFESAPAQLLVQGKDPPGNGGVGGAERLSHRVEPAQPGHRQENQQIVRTRKPPQVHHDPSLASMCIHAHTICSFLP